MPRKKTIEEYKQELSEKTNNEVILIGEYLGKGIRTTYYNKVLNDYFEIKPCSIDQWLRNHKGSFYRSPQFNVQQELLSREISFEDASKRVSDYDSNFKLVEYNGSKLPCKLKHLVCGNIYKCNFSGIIHGKCGCMNCKKSKPWTNDRFLLKIKELVGDEYIPMSDFKKMREKVKMKHSKCGNMYEVTPDNFIHRETRCPQCSHIIRISKPVKRLMDYLEKENFDYEVEFCFDDLFTYSSKMNRKYYLPFDFKINVGTRYFLLEYDGYQHKNGWNQNEESKLKNMKRDERKNKFCLDNNISLYRIGYTTNEDQIVNKFKKNISNVQRLSQGQRLKTNVYRSRAQVSR